MGGKSPIVASDEQRVALTALAGSRDRGEADRARAVLLTLSGWGSPQIAEAFGVREDTVRLWRSDFGRGGVDALKASIAPGPPPVKSETALRVVTLLLEDPVADRPSWTIARLRAEIEAREGVRISRSQLSKALRKKVPLAAAPAHAEGTTDRQRGGSDRLAPATAQASGRSWRHRSSLRRRKRGVDASLSRARLGEVRSRLARPGARTSQEGGDAGLARSRHAPTHRPYQPDQAQHRLCGPSRATRRPLRPQAREARQTGRAGRGQWADPRQSALARGPRGSLALAHRRVAAKVRPRAQRHRSRLARPQGASSRPSNLHRCRRARPSHPHSRPGPQP